MRGESEQRVGNTDRLRRRPGLGRGGRWAAVGVMEGGHAAAPCVPHSLRPHKDGPQDVPSSSAHPAVSGRGQAPPSLNRSLTPVWGSSRSSPGSSPRALQPWEAGFRDSACTFLGDSIGPALVAPTCSPPQWAAPELVEEAGSGAPRLDSG